MKIGEAAAQAGVNIQTLRFYERRGLLPSPRRSASGYRSYAADSVQVVRFIKQAQELGFALADVESLLRLAKGGPGGCRAVRTLAAQKVAELDRKITMLRSMRGSLARLVKTCDRPGARRECPLLEALERAAS
jgi:DNA-binding transcriptional MerR regulator